MASAILRESNIQVPNKSQRCECSDDQHLQRLFLTPIEMSKRSSRNPVKLSNIQQNKYDLYHYPNLFEFPIGINKTLPVALIRELYSHTVDRLDP